MSARTDAGKWPSCPGRIVTCRRGGCRAEATDLVIQLCEHHREGYEAGASLIIGRVGKAKPAGITTVSGAL
jgi:hypothetical protein